ncbi:MAG: hypothetical protein WBP64_18545 [Nitrososphaeraceae archaeon]
MEDNTVNTENCIILHFQRLNTILISFYLFDVFARQVEVFLLILSTPDFNTVCESQRTISPNSLPSQKNYMTDMP